MSVHVPVSIEEVYPRYSQRLLRVLLSEYEDAVVRHLDRTQRAHYHLSSMFEYEPLEFEIHPDDVIVSGSLFFKGASFAKRHAHPLVGADGQIPMEELERVPHPSFANSKREPKSFIENYVYPFAQSNWKPCKCVIFLASDLRCLKPVLEQHGINVVMMKHPSLAHNPGAMWRYLAFNFKCRAVCPFDTDNKISLARINLLLSFLEEMPEVALVRPLQATGKGGHMALILGSGFVVRPAAVDFDAAESMLGYVLLNLLTEHGITTFAHENRHGRSPSATPPPPAADSVWPHPSRRVPGKCFPYYGFDEQWLKEVVYYHFSNGRMATYIQHYNPDDLIQSLDLGHQHKNGNRFLEPTPARAPHGNAVISYFSAFFDSK